MKRLILTCCLLAATAAAHADTRLITRLDVLDVWQFNYNISHWLEPVSYTHLTLPTILLV